MKATLTFDLPEEHSDHLLAVKASDLAMALWDIDQELRSVVKYGQDEAQANYYEEVRDKLRDILNKYNIDFDELIV